MLEAPGETSIANILIFDFSPPVCEKINVIAAATQMVVLHKAAVTISHASTYI